jgi:hypothetical protein
VSTNLKSSIFLGNWVNPYAPADEVSFSELINRIDYAYDLNLLLSPVENRQIADVKPYLNKAFLDQELNATNLDEVFQGYNNREIANTTLSYIDYANKFLILDSNSQLAFPPAGTTIPYYQLDPKTTLLPGESVAIRQIIATANRQSTLSTYGITYSISISATNSTDISDFAIEILFDRQAINIGRYFEYSYQYLNSSNTVITSGIVRANKTTLLNVTSPTVFTTTVLMPATVNYNHQYNIPAFAGLWTRLGSGPGIKLNYPNSFSVNSTVSGLYLPGMGDGSKVTMNLTIKNVNTIDGYLQIFPIHIILSRGSGSANPNPGNIMPIIEYKVSG